MGLSVLSILRKRAAEALISSLIMILTGVYVHAIREQGQVKERLRAAETKCSENATKLSDFKEALDERTVTMRRELDQRTGEMQKQLMSANEKMEKEIASLERLITTLIAVLRQNGMSLSFKEDS